jgi:hypothetical protein
MMGYENDLGYTYETCDPSAGNQLLERYRFARS